MLNYLTHPTSLKQIGSSIEKHKTKQSLVSCGRLNATDCFVLCFSIRRSKLFETRQMTIPFLRDSNSELAHAQYSPGLPDTADAGVEPTDGSSLHYNTVLYWSLLHCHVFLCQKWKKVKRLGDLYIAKLQTSQSQKKYLKLDKVWHL